MAILTTNEERDTGCVAPRLFFGHRHGRCLFYSGDWAMMSALVDRHAGRIAWSLRQPKEIGVSGVEPSKTGFYCSDLFINLTER
jgi:hypothetical protein